MTWKSVAQLDDLKKHQRLCRSVDGMPLLLLWRYNQAFALENRCSHARKPLDEGKIQDHNIRCPYHGATFDIRTGMHTSPPAIRPIQTYQTRITENVVEIDL